ncbi:MAG TPA: AlkA N-terminal domain-containing protein, partial [Terriglobales bacterium]|nr:AlkA N-terminal domain-containing protein [Terriglobales bacterium]
ISHNDEHGCFEISLDDENPALVARVQFPNPRALFAIVERIRRMFDLNADWPAILECLSTDPTLAGAVQSKPGLRLPGCWNGFELAVRAILGQQISVKGATTLAGRIVRAYGSPFVADGGLTSLFPTSKVLSQARLTNVGLTKARAETIRALAQAVTRGELCFEGIVDSDSFLEQLREIPGIGEWTAQYIAMRALGDPDALPSGDIGLLRRLNLANARELEARAEAWRPWRAYGAVYLWSMSNGSTRPAEVIRTKSSTPDRRRLLLAAGD